MALQLYQHCLMTHEIGKAWEALGTNQESRQIELKFECDAVRPGLAASAELAGPPARASSHALRAADSASRTCAAQQLPGVRQGASGAGSLARTWRLPCGPAPLW